MTFKFGQLVRDRVTGFEGIAYGFCQYMTGCNQILIIPKAKENDHKAGTWFDEQRIEVKEGIVLEIENGVLVGSDINAPTK